MTTSAAVVAPVTDKIMRRSRSGRLECWGATTADGVWDFERTEEPGTPWSIGHNETRIVVSLQGTLRACRWYVAAGHAQADLGRLQAHDRGEHNGARDSWCTRC